MTTETNSSQEHGWEGFVGGEWNTSVNVRDFIQKNYSPYEGDDSFPGGFY